MLRSLHRSGLPAALPFVVLVVWAVRVFAAVTSETWAGSLALYCTTPVLALAFGGALSAMGPMTRGARLRLFFVTSLLTPLAGGMAPAVLLLFDIFSSSRKAFASGALASFPMVIGVVPMWLSWTRLGAEDPASLLRPPALRRLWLAAAVVLAWGAVALSAAPELSSAADRDLSAFGWEPPRYADFVVLRATAQCAILAVLASATVILVFLGTDRRRLARASAERGTPRVCGPYRGMPSAEAAPSRRPLSLRADVACLALVLAAGAYGVTRIAHVNELIGTDVEAATEASPEGRVVGFPSLRYQCEKVRAGQMTTTLEEHLAVTRATPDVVSPSETRWRRTVRGEPVRGACHVTFESTAGDPWRRTVRHAEYRAESG